MYGIIPFARLFNTTLQAPATEGADLGFDPNADRGDNFDPSLFEEEGGDAPSKPAEKAETEPEPAKDDEPAKKDPAEGTDESVDEGKDKQDKPEDKPEKKPSRAQQRIQQLNERNAALERQLAQKVGSDQAAQDIADLETESGRLTKEYHTALAEDPEKAAKLHEQIRRIDRQIAKIEAQAEADAAADARFEQRDLQATIGELTTQYPELDKGHDDYDAELTGEINAVFNGLISTMSSKSAALKRAVALVMGEHTRETKPAGLGDVDKQQQVREERRQEGAKRTVEAVKGQPKPSDAAGQSKPVEPREFKTIKDIAKASEEELARARGDEL